MLDRRCQQTRTTRSSAIQMLIEADSKQGLLAEELTNWCLTDLGGPPLASTPVGAKSAPGSRGKLKHPAVAGRGGPLIRVNFTLSEEQVALLDRRADSTRLSRSAVVQLLLELDYRQGIIPQEMTRLLRAEREAFVKGAKHDC